MGHAPGRTIVGLFILGALSTASQAAPQALPHPIKLPPGFRIEVYADDLSGVRFMALSPKGDLTVSRPRSGEILVLPDRNRDGKPDRVSVFATGLNRPHGVAWRDGALYVAETGAVQRLTDADGDLVAEDKQLVTRGLPDGGMHWTRTIGFGPDGMMYVSAGSSCNACVEEDPARATIMRFKPDGSGREIYARGLRNAVGFSWHPTTRDLWATDNGRDWLGNNLPPEELNRVQFGGHYGWPQCYGDRKPDQGDAAFCAKTIPPAVEFPAHMAPLGLTFYTGAQFPAEYRHNAFVAMHGSWNRFPPAGYKVVRVKFKDGKPAGTEDFATGWLRGTQDWGRPVDVLTAPDGALFLTDDAGGRIYRISYRP